MNEPNDHAHVQDRTAIRRRLLMVVFFGLAAVLVHHSRLGGFLSDVHRLRAEVESWGNLAPLLAFPVLTVLIAAGLPRILFNGLAGLLFGGPVGWLVAHSGTVVGNIVMYHAMAWFGRELSLRRIEHKPWFTRLRRRGGVLDVIAVRLVPVSAVFQNLALVAAEVRPGPLWTGTIVGTLPSTTVAVLLGAGFGEDSMRDAMHYSFLALAIVIMSAILVRRIARQRALKAVPDLTG